MFRVSLVQENLRHYRVLDNRRKYNKLQTGRSLTAEHQKTTITKQIDPFDKAIQ